MNTEQKIFLLVTVLGGTLVPLSYVLGLKTQDNVNALWGGVPTSARSMYTVSMLLGAISFFIFSIFMFLNLDAKSFVTSNIFGNWSVHILYALVLIPSALWIPLVNTMVSNPSTLIWLGVRLVLIVVGLASLLLLVHLLTLENRTSNIFYITTVVSISWFTIHTGILDALIWPYLWNR